ncbi:hypothetical protein HYH02_013825 [Chlamydomonas schloesseri]|uniref:Peptidase M11 gametolysin domain-containing protein n=1 Tax=Chlamydomonas schloesseri TaxID=2026947 RepID=A0A835SMP0_9CHLO|nr:hypothetical protein HYH02_013825 [Chlamydomonas schloesseri]|eukprot:KAG2429997.1 hypothetical protein HYH02_013825 [Chlamydomonas schloesseri]
MSALVLVLALAQPRGIECGRKNPPSALPKSPSSLQTLEGTLEIQTNDEDEGANQLWFHQPKKGRRQIAVPASQLRQQLMSGSRVRLYLEPAMSAKDAAAAPLLPVRYLEVLQLPPAVTSMYPMPLSLIGGSNGGGGGGGGGGSGSSGGGGGGGGSPSDPRASAGFSTARMSSITLLVRVCGQAPNITADEFRAQWYATGGGVRQQKQQQQVPYTMQGYFEGCSYGKMRFEPSENIVVGPVDVPCAGVSAKSGTPYSAASCNPDDVYGFADAAEAAAVRQYGVNLSKYRHRLVVLPQLASCGWKGLAEVGCGDYCYAWVKGVNARTLSTMFHELVHNLAAEHAAVPGSADYGDSSDPLGTCCATRCPNAPHAWQLGWAEPAAELGGGGLPAGVWRSFTLPSSALSDVNMLRISADWLAEPGAAAAAAPPPSPLPGGSSNTPRAVNGASGGGSAGAGVAAGLEAGGSAAPPPPSPTALAAAGAAPKGPAPPAVFVSYRTAEGYDYGLDPDSAGRVHVHVFNGTRYGTNGDRTQLQARLLPGQWWGAGADGGLLGGAASRVAGVSVYGALPWRLNISVVAADAATARVWVCRAAPEAREADCGNGLDDDCDGLADDDDPDCAGPVAELPGGGSGGGGSGGSVGSKGCNRNGVCEAGRGEGAASCPSDCPAVCGDGHCDLKRNESAASCPADCGPRCGDGFCDAGREERHDSCSMDCAADVCGDGVCGVTEDPVSCPRDCCAGGLAAPRCGDGVCDAFAGENCMTCAADCRGKRVTGSSTGSSSSNNSSSSTGSSSDGGGVASWSYCCGAGPGAGFFFSSGGCLDARCNKNGAACRTTCVV